MYCQDVHFVFKFIHPPFITHTYQVLLAFDSAFIIEISASWPPCLGRRWTFKIGARWWFLSLGIFFNFLLTVSPPLRFVTILQRTVDYLHLHNLQCSWYCCSVRSELDGRILWVLILRVFCICSLQDFFWRISCGCWTRVNTDSCVSLREKVRPIWSDIWAIISKMIYTILLLLAQVLLFHHVN